MLIFDCRLLADRWNWQLIRERKDKKTLLLTDSWNKWEVDISVTFEKLYARVIF